MLFCYTVGYKWRTLMDGIKFEFNVIISSYTKKDSERGWFVSLDILYFIYIVITYYLLIRWPVS